MSTKGEFAIYPVGQGLFYAGKLTNDNKEQFNFIYDCGSLEKKPLMNCINEYKTSFNTTKEIDMVVISHFDKDHVIGLIQLAKEFNIKRIFLPYLRNININLLSYILKTLEHKKVILKRDKTKIILIDQTNTEEEKKISNNSKLPSLENLESEASQSNSDFDLGDLVELFKISVFKKSKFRVFDWLFDFYNYPLPKNEILSINSSFNAFIHKNNIKSVSDFLKCDKFWKVFSESVYSENIKTYKFMKGNNLSLCLMHAPLKILTNDEIKATLLCGDLDLKKKEIYSDFNNKFNYIVSKLKIFFLPHHGSRKNWNDYLVHTYCKNTLSVITAATQSKHNHPDFEVISKVFLSKNDLLCITEKFDTYKYNIE